MAAFRKKDLKKPSITFNVSSIEVLSDSKVITTKIALERKHEIILYQNCQVRNCIEKKN